MSHGVAPFPLYWPLQHERTKYRRDAQFRVEFVPARNALLRELHLLGTRDVVLSSNVPIRRDGLPAVPDREPDDPGVAVYFNRRIRNGGDLKPYVIACDTFRKVRWNLRAIGETIAALRSIERHGSTALLEQAFSGFAALPPAAPAARTWREVLEVTGPVSEHALRARFRELARIYHPDVGGDTRRMAEINAAYETALREIGAAS